MTTDITELAKREKFEAWWEREYKHLESSKYTDAVPHIKYGFWMAYQAGGSELVDALEKAQQTEKTLKSRNCRLEGIITAAENRISELGKTIAEQDKRLINYAEISTRNAERAAEMESRTVTVKLPEPFKLAKSSSGLTYHYADEVDAALTAAGIKWESE